jgi:SAM-dependent methyltransferase
MSDSLIEENAGSYVLATGKAAAYRLKILHQVYGPGSREVLRSAGIRTGMRVADIGCGVGQVTADLAALVGPAGHVVGVDLSRAQLEQADCVCQERGLTNVSWVAASAEATGLPTASFDLVYCRFLLMHLVDPDAALREMHRLLRPGGMLVCEDGDVTSAGSEPSSALRLFADLFGALGPRRKVDYTLARRLFLMVRAAGFSSAHVAFNQPAFVRGDGKRLLEQPLAEAGPAFVEAGLIPDHALRDGVRAMRRLAGDETAWALMPRMVQVCAVKLAA